MPISQALRLCPDAMCVPVPRHACSDKSRAIRRVLGDFTPLVEGASIDEWYLDLTGTEALYHHEPLDATARRIRAAVLAATGLSVSIGGGPNKLIAKLAAERAKPSKAPNAGGVHIVPDDGVATFMATVALADIPGIGPKLQERLGKLGLTGVADVLTHDRATLERWTDKKTAAWLWRRVRGESDTAVEPRAPAKQVSREETFGRDLTDRALLETELRRLCAKVAADLRGDGLAARTITVKYRTNDWDTRTAGRTLAEPVESDRAVADTALALLAHLRQRQRKPARLVGVALSNFGPARDAEQLTMFGGGAAAVEAPRDRDLSRALDAVRARFGEEAIRSGPPRPTPLGEKGARRPREG